MIYYDSIINYSMWVWFVGVAMGVTYVLEASSKKLAPMETTTDGAPMPYHRYNQPPLGQPPLNSGSTMQDQAWNHQGRSKLCLKGCGGIVFTPFLPSHKILARDLVHTTVTTSSCFSQLFLHIIVILVFAIKCSSID